MTQQITKTQKLYELLFQLLLHVVVFIFYSFDKNNPSIAAHQIVFFLNYAVTVAVINYILLPKLFYRKRYWQFVGTLFSLIVMAILVEEFILEQIYFPDTRGRRFQGFFYGMLDVAPIVLILSGLKLAWDIIRKQQELEILRTTVKESELSFLKSQIHPHFLFNNLNNLYAYALENSPKTPVIILELSSVLRYMLYDCKEDFVSLQEDLKQLENYVRLSELQIEERGEVKCTVTGVLPEHRIAPLLLMVFVENAFKHSTSSMKDKILINIDIAVENNVLVMTCENTFLQQSNREGISTGIGLDNVKKRLALLYPDAYQLQISDDHHLYQVVLTIQLTKGA
ncbi:MAG: histidine kinase [Bacteroidota bacterium]